MLSLLLLAATSTFVVSPVPKVRTAPRFARGRYALVSLARGPTAEGDTSQGLDVASWAAWVDGSGKVRLQLVGDRNPQPDAASPFGLETFDASSVQRLSLAFDQNARRVLALSSSGQVRISRVIPGPPLAEQSDSFAGFDCLLWFDGLLRDVAAGEATDVIAFYLPESRDRIKYRLQAENFAIEREYLALANPVSLDSVGISQNRLVLFVTDRAGVTSSVVSERYPLRFGETLNLAASFSSGQNIPTVILAPDQLEPNTLSLATSFTAGQNIPTVILAPDQLEPNTLSFATSFSNGQNVLTVVGGGDTNEAISFNTAFTGGSIS